MWLQQDWEQAQGREPFELLKADILANGLHQPITLMDGMILDGGNRYKACLEVGIEPHFVPFPGGDEATFVESMNGHRRHYKSGQRAVIAAQLQDWRQAQVAGSNQHKAKASGPATWRDHESTSTADRAAQSGAGLRTQQRADKLVRADPELAMKVAHGEISLGKALKQLEPETKTEPTPEPAIDYSKEPLVSAWVLCTRAKAARPVRP